MSGNSWPGMAGLARVGRHLGVLLRRFLSEEKGGKPRKPVTGKAGATDIPSWARGARPAAGENGRAFAERLLNEHYGAGNWTGRGPGSEYNQLKKFGDRSF